MARADFRKVVIGRAEMLTFIDPSIDGVPAKIDTGAYRSAVHADNIHVSPDGKELSFRLLGTHPFGGSAAAVVTTDQFNKVMIENSFGQREDRYEVRLRVKLGPRVFSASFTLADRSKKTYPILLGRQLLNSRFLVDTAETSVDRAELKRHYGSEFPADEEEGK
jgi:hypothetical protein